ncbi:piggyBac transposable element-derived protein 4-like [Homarus americanus]|uniref:piggyBac transposable element-derived protein 4-like n=1 Tax=Homarus americanus TaxID=6706 RepID=UPI001C46CE5C|nr:piggyBac transposable element-derived protein 4-like [Homarus americanus]
MSNYIPKENISIDESLLLWKGKWKRYIPIKRARFGIETSMLAEAETGYEWDLLLYTGKGTEYACEIPGLSDQAIAKLSKPSKIVLAPVKPLLNMGYVLGMDNFYVSPELYDILLAHGTDAVGTVRFNRKGLSDDVKEKKLNKGETITRFNNKVMHMKWRDKEYVNMLSTVYEDSMEMVQSGGKEVSKPTVCIKYKRMHMEGVDLMDQVTSASSVTRKGVTKYYKKLFFRLIEMSLHNCHVIYKRNGGQENLLGFKLLFIEQTVSAYSKDVY